MVFRYAQLCFTYVRVKYECYMLWLAIYRSLNFFIFQWEWNFAFIISLSGVLYNTYLCSRNLKCCICCCCCVLFYVHGKQIWSCQTVSSQELGCLFMSHAHQSSILSSIKSIIFVFVTAFSNPLYLCPMNRQKIC